MEYTDEELFDVARESILGVLEGLLLVALTNGTGTVSSQEITMLKNVIQNADASEVMAQVRSPGAGDLFSENDVPEESIEELLKRLTGE